MRKLKRFIAVTLACSLGLSISAYVFSGCSESEQKDTMPSYTEEKTFLIGGWGDPPNSLACYQTVKDMGMDFLFFGGSRYGMGAEGYLESLEMLEEVGLKAILQTGSGADGQSGFDKETDFSQYPAVMALNYWDEPNLSNMDALDELADWHIGKYGETDVNFYVNLFPYTDRIGGSYAEYLDSVCAIAKKVKEATGQESWLSVDIYPLLSSKYGSTVSTSWLTNFEEVALASQKYEMDHLHAFLLSTQHGSYRSVTEADYSYQAWVYMAFGADSFSYFTYASNGSDDSWGPGLADLQGNPVEPNYSGAKTVNAEIHAIDDVYLSFEWEGMYPVTGSETENLLEGKSQYYYGLKSPLTSLDKISSVESTKDTLIGQFHDAEGRKGYVVTNFADPYYGEESANEVNLTFADADTVMVCRGGTQEVYRVSDNRMTLNLKAGEGVFIIPLNLT